MDRQKWIEDEEITERAKERGKPVKEQQDDSVEEGGGEE